MNLTKLRLILNNSTVETFETAALIEQLFQIASANGSDVLLKGYIYSGKVYEQTIEYLTKRFIDFHIVLNNNVVRYVKFDEPDLEALLISKGIGDGTGLKVLDLSNIEGYGFCKLEKQWNSNPPPINPVSSIKKFNEFKYFINLDYTKNLYKYDSSTSGSDPKGIELTLPYNFNPCDDTGNERTPMIPRYTYKLSWEVLDKKEINTKYILSNVSHLTEINFPVVDKIGYNIGDNVPGTIGLNLPNVEKLIFPEGVKYIGNIDFNWDECLKYVEFPSTLISINLIFNKTYTYWKSQQYYLCSAYIIFKSLIPPFNSIGDFYIYTLIFVPDEAYSAYLLIYNSSTKKMPLPKRISEFLSTVPEDVYQMSYLYNS